MIETRALAAKFLTALFLTYACYPAMAQVASPETPAETAQTASPAVAASQSVQPASPGENVAPSDTSAAAGAIVPASDPAIDALLSILKDDQTRAALVRRLEQLQADPVVGEGGTESSGAAGADTPTLAREIAESTKGIVEGFYLGLQNFWRDMTGVQYVFETMSPEKRDRVSSGALYLAGTIASVLALYRLIFSGLARGVLKLPSDVEAPGVWRSVVMIVLASLRDSLALVVAFAVGYLVSFSLFGPGQLGIEQSLFLNAFLIAGAFQIIMGVFVHPERTGFSVFRPTPEVASAIYGRGTVLIWILAFGLVTVVPIANYWANFATGRALRIVIVSAAAIWALVSIHHIARISEDAEEGEAKSGGADEKPADATGIAESFLVAVWPFVASLYVISAWGIAIAQPALMADLIGTATIQSLVVGALTVVGLRALGSLRDGGVPVPRQLQKALPQFKGRVESFVPFSSRVLSVMLMLIAAFFLLDAWNLIDGTGLLGQPEVRDIGARLGSAMLILGASVLIWAIVSSIIDNRLSLDLPGRNVTARTRTLLSLFKNAFTVVVLIFATMTGLSQIGLDIAPLLAGAGVVGLAIGFGAQKLVQDVITGIFIQIENAINEGDVITVAGITGVVEKLTIRSVGVRDQRGVYHIVPFSAVDTVSNFMRKFAYHVEEVGVAYKEHIPAVKEAMHAAFLKLKESEHGRNMIGDFEMQGVVALADSSVNVRARIKTRPGKQWEVGRAYTELVKEVFDDLGIEIPYPHRTMVYQGGLPPEAAAAAEQLVATTTKSAGGTRARKATT